MNRVDVSGNLTRDPELSYLGERGIPVLRLNIAVDDGASRRDRESGQYVVGTGFYSVEVLGTQAEVVAETAGKGDRVYVVGWLQQFQKRDDAVCPSCSEKLPQELVGHTRIRAEVVTVIPKYQGTY